MALSIQSGGKGKGVALVGHPGAGIMQAAYQSAVSPSHVSGQKGPGQAAGFFSGLPWDAR